MIHANRDEIPLLDLLGPYFASKAESKEWSSKTVTLYCNRIKQAINCIKVRTAGDINLQSLNDLRNHYSDPGINHDTLRAPMQAFAHFIEWLIRKQIITLEWMEVQKCLKPPSFKERRNDEELIELLDKFISKLTVLDGTKDNYKNAIKNCLKTMNAVYIKDLDIAEIKKYHDTVINDQISHETIRRKFNAPRYFFQWLRKKGLHDLPKGKIDEYLQNPVPQNESNSKYRKDFDFDQLVNAVKNNYMDYALLLLIANTDLKKNEILYLKIEYFRVTQDRCILKCNINHNIINIKIPNGVVDHIREYLKSTDRSMDETGWVWQNRKSVAPNPNSMSPSEKLLNNSLKRIGMAAGFSHGIRFEEIRFNYCNFRDNLIIEDINHKIPLSMFDYYFEED